MVKSFLTNNQNKNELKKYLSLKFLELHRNDTEIHAYLINSDKYYKQIIQELGSDIFLALPFFYAFTWM